MNKITDFLDKVWNFIINKKINNKKDFVENVVINPKPIKALIPVVVTAIEKTKKMAKKSVIQVKKAAVKKENKNKK